MSLEGWLRTWLNRRWRQQATQAEISEARGREAMDAERESIARLQGQVVLRLAYLARAERSDGFERADLVAQYHPKEIL